MPWSTAFDDPVPLANGSRLVALHDAVNYIQALPKAEQEKPHWQLAVSILIAVAERRDPILHARIAIMRALNHDRPPPAPARRTKPAKKLNVSR